MTSKSDAFESFRDSLFHYAKAPSDGLFTTLLRLRPFPDAKVAAFSDLIYAVVLKAPASAMTFRHLAIALYLDARLIESVHYARQWICQDPASLEAYRLLGMASIERGDALTAAEAYGWMQEHAAPEIDPLRLWIAIALTLNRTSAANEAAHHLSRLEGLTPGDYKLIAEAAVRSHDPSLLSLPLQGRGQRTYGDRREIELTTLARQGLLQVLLAKR